jgi:hypothetical protein
VVSDSRRNDENRDLGRPSVPSAARGAPIGIGAAELVEDALPRSAVPSVSTSRRPHIEDANERGESRLFVGERPRSSRCRANQIRLRPERRWDLVRPSVPIPAARDAPRVLITIQRRGGTRLKAAGPRICRAGTALPLARPRIEKGQERRGDLARLSVPCQLHALRPSMDGKRRGGTRRGWGSKDLPDLPDRNHPSASATGQPRMFEEGRCTPLRGAAIDNSRHHHDGCTFPSSPGVGSSSRSRHDTEPLHRSEASDYHANSRTGSVSVLCCY